MTLRLLAASVAAVAIGAGTASAQYPALVPHRGHYHVAPSYAPPVTGGFGFGYSSPGFGFGYTSPGYYAPPAFGHGHSHGFGYGHSHGYGYGGHGHGWGGHSHGHRHHHH
jgi:hypothetical protein